MFGYYGKIPAHGDFVRSRADVAFVAAWDAWLQDGLAASRAELAEDWEQAYQNAPIWRFCFGPKICGPHPMIGVMMPSQDRVGRRFPLTVFHPVSQDLSQNALDLEPFMTKLEDIALLALTEQLDKSQFSARLDTLVLPDLPATDGAEQMSYWLSTFFGGAPRRDTRTFEGLPKASYFADLLAPKEGDSHV